ncbi:MAG: ketoacyl-ACP synthase III [Proteobacteria bacterium]|nr:ketoacyl-ACP synthase III [Pseudomonadota bacterium]
MQQVVLQSPTPPTQPSLEANPTPHAEPHAKTADGKIALVTASGSYLPKRILTNHELAKTLDTSDEWIQQRTGIKQRHIAADGELTSDLAVAAAKQALITAKLTASDIDGIIVATTTPDDTFPSTASVVQHKLGAKGAFAFDVQAVCAGFIYGLDVADAMVRCGKASKMLVIGAETFSRLLDWDDRSTAVLFGDGAGAVVLESAPRVASTLNTGNTGATKASHWGILASALFTDGQYRDILYADDGPARGKTSGVVKMQGQEVFKHAVEKLAGGLDAAMAKANITADEIDWLVPHQANLRIINMMQKKLKLPDEKVIRTVAHHANTSAASIPLALDYALRQQKIKNGEIVALEAIGGGLTWGASIVRIGKP